MTRQTDGKSLYEQQEERILAQSDAFISLLTKRGILGDHQIDNEKVRKAKQEKNRKSYHNTQLLLQHYRNIAWLLECSPVDVAAELDEPFEGVDKLIDQMDLEIALGKSNGTGFQKLVSYGWIPALIARYECVVPTRLQLLDGCLHRKRRCLSPFPAHRKEQHQRNCRLHLI